MAETEFVEHRKLVVDAIVYSKLLESERAQFSGDFRGKIEQITAISVLFHREVMVS